jgi:hypothetical protein
MKKFTLLMFAAVLTFGSVTFAQKNVSTPVATNSIAKPFVVSNDNNAKVITTDTIWSATSYMACGDSLTYYSLNTASVGNNGYLTGNNKYGDLEKGMLIKHTGAGNVTGVIVMVVKKGNVGTGTCAVNLYSKGADNLPGTLLGTSVPKTLSTITTNTNTFTFSPAIAVTGDFFANVVLPTTAGDTIIVISTKGTCQGPDSVSVDKASDNSFMYMKTGWNFNGDLAIWPIVESGSATSTYPVNFSVVNGNGTLTATVDATPITSGASVTAGKNVVFTATPAGGYVVKEWKDNSVVVSGNTTTSYTVSNLAATATVSVEFKLPQVISNNAIENLNDYSVNNQIAIQNNSNLIVNQVVVYNLMGQEVAKFDVQKSESMMLNADFASSNYIVKVIANNVVGTYKVFVK